MGWVWESIRRGFTGEDATAVYESRGSSEVGKAGNRILVRGKSMGKAQEHELAR